MDRADVPVGARPVARVLLLARDRRLLLLHARDGHTDACWWVTPGGGLEPDESFVQAARRELVEETGIDTDIGPWVWTRRHRYVFEGRPFDQYERFFVATTDRVDVSSARQPDAYVIGHRWWGLHDIAASAEEFAPGRLANLLEPIVRGRYPTEPVDCGV